jgi:hypothetical protein
MRLKNYISTGWIMLITNSLESDTKFIGIKRNIDAKIPETNNFSNIYVKTLNVMEII